MNKNKDRLSLIKQNLLKAIIDRLILVVVLILMAASVLGVAAPGAEAAIGINQAINYQGRLMDNSGANVADGIYQIEFTLYDQASGGAQLWSASTTNGLPTGTPVAVSVSVQSGLFTILLGDTGTGQVPLDIDWNQDSLFLGITIGADAEMTPRKRLTAVPYAFNSQTLQGQYASNTVSNSGGDLFALHQGSSDAASATRTALYVETKGTSNTYDYLLRLSDGISDVFSINRQGNATTTGSMAIAGTLSIQGIRLDSVGSNPLTSGAYLLGVYDEFTFSNATTVQAVLKDFDTTIESVSSSAANLTLQNVTDNGNTTTNAIVFAGGTSTGDFMPGAHLTYDLGREGNRWDELFVRKVRMGTNSWDLETDANNTFLLSEVSNGNFFAITENGRVGIGTSTPSTFDLEVNGTIGPAQNNLFDLGSNDLAWRNITAAGTVSSTNGYFGNVTSTNLDVLGNITANAIYIGGIQIPTTTPSFDDVTSEGNVTVNKIQFAGGTSTGDFIINGDLEAENVSSTYIYGTTVSTTELWVNGQKLEVVPNIFQASQAAAFSDNTIDNWQSITLNHDRMDSYYTHTNTNSSITITATGTYRVSGHVSFEQTASNVRSVAKARIYLNNSSSLTDEIFAYSRNVASGEGTATIPPKIVNLNAGDYLDLQATLDSGTATIQSLSASILIEAVTIGGTGMAGATQNLQEVTDQGSVTTNAIQFAGGTSTNAFTLQNDFTVAGTSYLQHLDFVTATGTSLQLTDNLFMGSGVDVDSRLITLNTGDGLNNSSLQYSSNYYGYKGLIWQNPDAGESAILASQSLDNEAELLAMTGNRNSNAVFNLYSDTDGFGTLSGIRGWEVGRRGSDATFDFSFYNADTGDGKPTVSRAQLLTINGFDAQMTFNGSGIFNEDGGDYDFRVEGETDEYLLFIDASTNRIGMGTSTPSERLHVEGNIYSSGTVSSTNALFVNATGSRLDVTGTVRLPLDTKVNDVLLCLSDGTNCPSSAASNLQTVTNAGNTTTNALQFAGGTSTADFRFQQNVLVDGNVSSTSALFINATGTNFALLGYVNSNINPLYSDTFSLGDTTHRWQGLVVNNVTTTNILATGYVSSSAMYINGLPVTTTTPTLDQVTTQGNTTSNSIQFAGGTSTGLILPGTTDIYDLGSTAYRWRSIYGNNLKVGTSTLWTLETTANSAFTISNNGGEMARFTSDGNLYVGTTAYTGGLGSTFVPNGNEILTNGDIGAMGSVYAGTSFRAGATSTVYSKNSLYKQDGGDYLFQFANVAATPELITSFESSFPPADWALGGDANWFQDFSTSTQGTYSAESGDINDLEISYIETDYTFSSDGLLEFDWKVSSEATYDFLLFCIDNAGNCTDTGGGDYARIDGETDWATVSVPITAGTHNLRWVYDKDYSVSEGSDAGWIDNVRFSPYSGQNWRFFTNATERLTVAYSGNVGIGVSSPTAKLDINGDTKARGNVTITAAPSKTETTWTSSNKSTTGIESVRSLATFNGYLYAGQGDGGGDGDIQVCNPVGGGSATICDNAADWSASYSTAAYSQVLTMIVYKGRLYAGLGDGSGLGDVIVCNPATTGSEDVCDAGDWSDAAFPAGPNRITQLMEYNGYLYASNDTGANGSASVAICNPAGGGTATACDNAADWSNITLPIAYEQVNSMTVYRNVMYAFVGNTNDDSDLFICDPASAGTDSRCDNASDWTRPFDNTAGSYETSYSSAVYNGYMYVGRGLSSGDGDLLRCEPQAAGDDALCDNAGDFTTVINNPNGITGITALMSYDGSLYIGQEGSTSNGDIIEMTDAIYKTSDVATGLEATYAFATLNGVLYAGRGNSTGDGQVYFYQKARESSYALNFQASSSTGSMWFSSESLNYQGAGTGYDAQSGAFKFSHGIITESGSYDLAEMYPTMDDSITAGDVVILDSQNPGYVAKADKSYDGKLIGVVSTKPGFLLSGPKEKDVNSRAIALVGRVPVKISLENGDIEIGDPLTSASLSGYAMKATKPGMIIGHAMEAFSSSTTSTLDGISGNLETIKMVVQTGYYFGSNETPLGQIAGFLGETTSTQIVQQAFDGDAYAIEQIAGGLVNPQIADGSALNNVSAAQVDVLIVKTAALIAGDLTVGGESKLLGHLIVSNDTAGVVDLPVGESYVEIRFTKPFESVPVVVVTPESDAEEYFSPWMGKFRIAKKTVNGFRIEVDEGACEDPSNCGRTMKFNWIAVGVIDNEIDSATTTNVGDDETLAVTTSSDAVLDQTNENSIDEVSTIASDGSNEADTADSDTEQPTNQSTSTEDIVVSGDATSTDNVLDDSVDIPEISVVDEDSNQSVVIIDEQGSQVEDVPVVEDVEEVFIDTENTDSVSITDVGSDLP